MLHFGAFLYAVEQSVSLQLVLCTNNQSVSQSVSQSINQSIYPTYLQSAIFWSDRIQKRWDTTLGTIGQLEIVGFKSRFEKRRW